MSTLRLNWKGRYSPPRTERVGGKRLEITGGGQAVSLPVVVVVVVLVVPLPEPVDPVELTRVEESRTVEDAKRTGLSRF